MSVDKVLKPLEDGDMDSLFILPLRIIPLETPALKTARLIKNVRLRSVVELFSNVEGTGSGQVEIESLPKMFGWPEDKIHPDFLVVRKLGLLPSYDIYSLRISLRQQGISVNSSEALRLSPEKNAELTNYMTLFTRPLIHEIYGDENVNIQSFDDVIALFRDPDIQKAKQNLTRMADKLHINLSEVPRFIEDYGDIFLSLSYYRQSLDKLEPIISDFLGSMYDIRNNWQLKQDANLLRTCDMIESTMNGLMANITGRFENFDRSTKDMWNNISADRFRKVKELIESYHTSIGGILCALTVKMNAWARAFPKKQSGGPVKRGELIMSEMKQGIDTIKKTEDDAPMLASLN
ncbi:MAG: hypothetical protein HQL44_07595 [Alphaproteobacteria bacterium]|nr:hypothetical protein [Alphaproteobacteria bacterium]